jgi:hypothetical protein
MAMMRHASLTLVSWLIAGAAVAACPVCFQMEEGPVTEGVRAAVVVLMGVTAVVLGGFGVWIARFVRRTRNPDRGRLREASASLAVARRAEAGTAEPRNP